MPKVLGQAPNANFLQQGAHLQLITASLQSTLTNILSQTVLFFFQT
jgi:hypothetical protein